MSRISLEPGEIMLLTNILNKILEDNKPFRDIYDRVSQLRRGVKTKNGYVRFTPEDVISVNQILKTAKNVLLDSKMTEETTQEQKDRLLLVQSTVSNLLQKLSYEAY